MLHTIILNTETDLDRFGKVYAGRSGGMPVDADFLRQGTIRVFYDDQQPERWLAGYCVNDHAPYRYLSVHTPTVQAALLAQHQILPDDIVEIGAIWMDVAGLGRAGRWQVYQFMLADAYATGKGVVLGGTVYARIRDFQMQVVKYPLFDGTVLLGGKQQRVWLYFARREELWFDFFRFTTREFSQPMTGPFVNTTHSLNQVA